MRVIIGAGDQTQPGWLPLQRNDLDIRDRAQWARLFTPNLLDAVLSEHVLEHLSFEEANAAARNIYEFLAPAGYWRIAVPDANNPDPVYQEMCRPGGTERWKFDFWGKLFNGPDTPGHKEHLRSGIAYLPVEQCRLRCLTHSNGTTWAGNFIACRGAENRVIFGGAWNGRPTYVSTIS